ncbi:MAG: TonB-dependent receptor plug domain-containing protein [Melioribacteraceae bacterium]|nr:TonB-dependent receptor plug domain-containing protein [Melioribacteraceae bacterium]
MEGSSLGTQVIIDGVPVSNTANLQAGIGYSTAGSGVDLRLIPAENIESVEIIRGVPSVKYGDLVDGAVIVKSKASRLL